MEVKQAIYDELEEKGSLEVEAVKEKVFKDSPQMQADLEEKLERLDAEMAANATNSKRLSELAAEREQTEADLEHKMERWEYLEELAEKIQAQG